MIRLYLILIDIIIPILVGLLISILNTGINILPYIVFSLTLFIFSFFKGFYDNYYSRHFSEKLKISFITSITVIFFQLIFYSYISFEISLFIVFSWILIPAIILFLRYILKMLNKSINDVVIVIIGNLYKFNSHEIKILTDKAFTVYFYDELQNYLEKKSHETKNQVIVVVNMSTNEIKNTKSISMIDTISLGEFMESYLRKIYIDDTAAFNNINKYNKTDFFMKRLIDYTSVLVLLPFLIGASIYTILMKIFRGYKGSFIYTQERYGINQKIFSLFKLRTMHKDSDTHGNTVKNDERIYSFAKTLRKFRLDELPQIINIFLGDMHLVGPRAEWVKLSDEYSKSISNYSLRSIVRPGITGWAQVLYQYGFDINDSKQKLMYELFYIKNWTVWLELEICIKTITVILDKKGF